MDSDGDFITDHTLTPGSFATLSHALPPWIFKDEPIERAIKEKKAAKLNEARMSARLSAELKKREESRAGKKKEEESRAEENKEQEELEQRMKERQKSEMAKARLRQHNCRSEMQRHIDVSFSSNLFHSVDINGLMQAYCTKVDTFEVIATLMQATVGRLQALERQNAILHAENHAQNAVIDRQNAVIDQLVSRLNQQQPCLTSASITASLKESLAQLHEAALLSDQCFSACAKAPSSRSSVDDDVSGSSAKSAKAAARSSLDDDVSVGDLDRAGVHFNLFD
jgi:hypothetical protein